jgi:hypothetical protein
VAVFLAKRDTRAERLTAHGGGVHSPDASQLSPLRTVVRQLETPPPCGFAGTGLAPGQRVSPAAAALRLLLSVGSTVVSRGAASESAHGGSPQNRCPRLEKAASLGERPDP